MCHRASAAFVLLAACSAIAQPALPHFSYAPYLTHGQTLHLASPRLAGDTVTIDGGDSRRPAVPFTFEWGDGTRSEAFFPARHIYADPRRNYAVTVTAHYGAEHGSSSTTVRFGPAEWHFVRDVTIPRRVTVAAAATELESTLPGYRPPALAGFADADLAVPRALLEYLLDVGHAVELDLCNHDVDPIVGPDQVVLKAADFGGAFSLWFTRPMALGANPSYLSDLGGVSSLFHEMGHNLTLNSPARFRCGGKTDGPMSTIVSETLAQIMQHATAWLILNHPSGYGLPAEALSEVRRSALGSLAVVTGAYEQYRAGGCHFRTAQPPVAGQPDPTFATFMTVAWVFLREAEAAGDFRQPTQRLMALLQTFCERDRQRFQQPANEGFRAALVTAALSHAFGRDLRPAARELQFPLDQAVYAELLGRMAPPPR